MCQPKKWVGWLPILALAALWFLANAFFKVDPIKADLEARAAKSAIAAAGSVSGIRPVGVDVAGRDVTLKGEVAAADAVGKVRSTVDNEFGVRRVEGAPALVAAIKPYTWAAQRDGQKITLTGFVPDEAVKKANAEAAAKAFAGVQVDDQQKIGFGAASLFAGATAFLLPEIAKLETGKLSLSDSNLCVEGRTATRDLFAALQTRLQALPAGLTRTTAAPCLVSQPDLPPPPPPPPPVAPPAPAPVVVAPPVIVAPPAPVVVAPPAVVIPPVALEWTAQKTEVALALSGMAPNDAARGATRTAAASAVIGSAVNDNGIRLVPNLKAEPNYGLATQFALGQLRPLTSGSASIRDTALEITGVAPTPAIKRSIEEAIRGRLPDGIKTATSDIVVRPYVFQARSEGGSITLEGLVPDLQTRNEILAVLDGSSFKGKIKDELIVVTGAPSRFGETAKLAVQNLIRVDDGAARLVNTALTFYGTTCRAGAKDVADTSLKVNLAQGFTSGSTIDLKKPADCGVCTVELTKVKGQLILFQQGKPDLATDAGTKGILDQVAGILKTCPASKVTIEGHTNFDGERRGYDNKSLSESRAKSVIAALAERGIAAARMSPKGFGATAPLIPHGTEEARVRNRRVDFVAQ
jgi:OmpA-OmpF porin, OOP family